MPLKDRLIRLAIFLFTAFLFTYQLAQAVFGDYFLLAWILCLAAVLLLVFLLTLRMPLARSFAFPEWGWAALLVMVVATNHFDRSGYLRFGMTMISLAMLFMLSRYDGWQAYAVRCVSAFSMIHVFATLVFAASNGLYLKLMPGLWGGFPVGTVGGAKGYAAGLTSHYSFNGTYCAVALIVQAVLFLFNAPRTPERMLRAALMLVLTFAALLLTTKRAHALFSALAILVVYYFLSPHKAGTRLFKALGSLLLGALLFLTAAMLLPALRDGFLRFFEQEDVSTGRFRAWEYAWRLFLAQPLTGIGWYGFSGYYPLLVEVHNVYLQILCELGVVGFVLVVPAMFACAVQTLRAFFSLDDERDRALAAASAVVQVFVLMYSLTGCCLTDVTQMAYYLACAMGCSFCVRLKRQRFSMRGLSA